MSYESLHSAQPNVTAEPQDIPTHCLTVNSSSSLASLNNGSALVSSGSFDSSPLATPLLDDNIDNASDTSFNDSVVSIPTTSLSWWLLLLLGQAISLFNTGTGVFSQLLANRDVSVPTLQSLINYLLMTLYVIPLYCLRSRARRRHERTKSDSPSTIVNTTSTATSLMLQPQSSLFSPLHSTALHYLLIALCDVEGNFFVVTAYRYTTLTSVQLLDCFNIPIVMILSRLFLHVRFTKQHIFACLLCLCGLALCVASDIAQAHASDDGHGSWRQSLLGDACVLLGCLCYGCSNVGQELVVKERPAEPVVSPLGAGDELEVNVAAGPVDVPSASDEGNVSVRFHAGTVGEGGLRWHGVMEEQDEGQAVMVEETVSGADIALAPAYTLAMTETELSLSRRWEFLAYLGLFGSLLSIVQVFLVERDRIMALSIPDLDTVLYALGFNACLFMVYSLVPVMLLHGSAVILNLSLLTADPFSVAASVIFFDNTLNFLYFIAFGIIIVGIVMYNLTSNPAESPPQEHLPSVSL